MGVTSKPHRDRRTLLRHGAALVAIVALVGQTFFPHVHAAPLVPRAPIAVATQAAGASLIRATPIATDGDSHRDTQSTCPLCRAQNDARSSLLPTALVLAAPATGIVVAPRDAIATPPAAMASVAVPRAPPFAC